jgi:tRNA 5-methylaminomethyl-2-thiouridine biosynthesis bifunctional protein
MAEQYYASIEWRDNVAYSTLFDDIFFSQASGIKEKRYVFHQHNNLADRFTDLTTNEAFIIGESGFGSGLNFLTTLKLWRNTPRAEDSSLHFISFEKYPLTAEDLRQIVSYFPELTDELEELSAQYYLVLPGHHRLTFTGNVKLTLIIGDIQEQLPLLNHKIDAWFFDGFSPAKNAEMWNQPLLNEIAAHCHANTTFATYSANSQLRRNLEAAGFLVQKGIGFANKRNLLFGKFNRQNLKITTKKTPKHYYAIPIASPQDKSQTIAIIGAGISGASTAQALANRGYHVVVFEKNPEVASEASGNYQGMLYGSWSAFGGAMMELSCSAYRFSHYLIKATISDPNDFAACGLIQLGHNEQQIKRNQQLLQANLPAEFITFVNNTQIEQLSGCPITPTELSGIYFPHGMWLKPPRLVSELLEHPNIKLVTDCEIQQIKHDSKHWLLYEKNNSAPHNFTHLILCNAHAAANLIPDLAPFLRKIRGQTTVVENTSSQLKTVLCGNGYITPATQGKFTLGATFQFNDELLDIREQDHQENLANFSNILPELIQQITPEQLSGKANFRTSTYDYLPLVGPLADYAQFNQDYAKLTKDKKAWIETPCNYLPNLWLNLAHGAKGLLTAPLCGEIIADYISNSPLACSEIIRVALHPNRVYVRELVKSGIKEF